MEGRIGEGGRESEGEGGRERAEGGKERGGRKEGDNHSYTILRLF